ncbi:MAG: tRNA (adenosine(37)-N6)-dimethylallyltransferase MiaA [Planctomycetes bacterium]|nr:tRNA (adenosine(37)-N6)-dimethylallyltransferase MiaA [Planctomycetota bacterium]
MMLITGCTASGKGGVAFELARRLGGEIVSVDSMKVYRGMDVGTAKPSVEKREAVKHHLVDVVEAYEAFSVGRYVELADEVIAELMEKKSPIITVGGTAMYIRALLEGLFEGPPADAELRERLKQKVEEAGLAHLYKQLQQVDPVGAERIHPNDMKRIIRGLEVYELTGKALSSFQTHFRSGNYRYDCKIFCLRREKEDSHSRINQRVKKMIEKGLIEEVKGLLANPKGLSQQAAQAVGYAEIIDHLNGVINLSEAIEKIKVNTRRLAKRQRTWFRSFDKVNWVEVESDDNAEQLAAKVLGCLE